MSAQAVVNAERFGRGLTFEQYVASMQVNREQLQQNYDAIKLSADDRQFFAGLGNKLGTKIKFLALVEDWCPDVYRGLPVAARIAGSSADIELRVFRRDENLDIMDQYLYQGKFQSIPTFVFFDEQFNEIGRWIERPAAAHSIYEEVRELLAKRNVPKEELRKLASARLNEVYVARLAPETVREIREALSRK